MIGCCGPQEEEDPDILELNVQLVGASPASVFQAALAAARAGALASARDKNNAAGGVDDDADDAAVRFRSFCGRHSPGVLTGLRFVVVTASCIAVDLDPNPT